MTVNYYSPKRRTHSSISPLACVLIHRRNKNQHPTTATKMNGAMRRSLISSLVKRNQQQRSLTTPATQQQIKLFHTAPLKNGGGHDHHHHEHYTDEEGRLFNIPRGETYKNEGWEYGHYIFFGGGLLALLLALTFKPDYSVDTWADDEFLRRKNAREQQK